VWGGWGGGVGGGGGGGWGGGGRILGWPRTVGVVRALMQGGLRYSGGAKGIKVSKEVQIPPYFPSSLRAFSVLHVPHGPAWPRG